MTPEEIALARAMAAMAPAGVRTGCRIIREGDETHLLSAEAGSIPARQPAMRRASGAARWIAHRLLADAGFDGFALLRTPSGAPAWPQGITGSLAHDDDMAVAAVAPVAAIGSLGIDVEPALPLPDEISALVAMPADRIGAADRQLAGRILFAAKEAVYKAAYPLDREVLGYEDIAVDLETGHATTRTGRKARLTYCVAPRVAVLAFVDGDGV
ncbi:MULTISPECIES: 4'-phosphopantetheinyl transferase superfamily protein [unclassified Mesorhizobium]|uniref:4'-phosphopantetheinyl transferase family protein n=1 Tax=unclassified Mesorhizobium TaxID=325217 RepID=UPI001093CB13|nr:MULTISPECIES: 4'-phosphopantetheinyl transferase superfamily protein [unclassified Mesorhizobium]TGS48534.1 4'-phosphopantetheinyl transferase superfamily protein [Mesorhizobium sp. M8A.F.Ca.ET.182.01.1.1]TGS83174.1 4'-phosphopantetheinyl transferase superfamily protein [Mesorhizobium sp. M8A.F.Ca.ET.181.01.1.1]